MAETVIMITFDLLLRLLKDIALFTEFSYHLEFIIFRGCRIVNERIVIL